MRNFVKYVMTLALAVMLIPLLTMNAKAADNTAFSSATTVAMGSSVEGVFTDSSQGELYYLFTMDKGGVFTYQFLSDTVGNANVDIYNENRQCVFSGSGDIKEDVSLCKGTYYLTANHRFTYGSFTLKFSADYAADSQNNNTFSKAAPMTIGTDLSCNFGRNGDGDTANYEPEYYTFTMAHGGMFTYTIVSDTVNSAEVEVYKSTGSNDVLVYGNGSSTDTFSLAKGTYVIKLSKRFNDGNFTLKTSVKYAKNSNNNNTFTKAAALSIGTKVYGNFGRNDDNSTGNFEVSYYKFTMTTGGVFHYSVASDYVSSANVEIFNSKQVSICSSLDAEDSFSLPKGTYYIRLSKRFQEGNFTLTTSVKYAKDSVNNNSFTKAKAFSLGTALYCNFGKNANGTTSYYEVPYYKFTMKYNGTMKYSISSDTVQSATLILYKVSGTSKKEIQNTTELTGSFSLTKGTYYIKLVKRFTDGNFKLTTKVRYANPMTVKAAKTVVSYSKTKAQTIKLTVSNAQGKVTYKSSSTAKATVSSKGVITIKKGAKKGYVYIYVKAAGTSSSNAVSYAASANKKITIRIK